MCAFGQAMLGHVALNVAIVWPGLNMSQHIATRWPNACNMLCPTMLGYVVLECCVGMFGRSFMLLVYYACSAATMLSPSQTIATCHGNTSQHCWSGNRTRDTLVGGERSPLRQPCSPMLGVVGLSFKMVKFEPTTPNMSQHGGQTRAKCCVQQCCDMLCWHVAIVWPGLYRVTELN